MKHEELAVFSLVLALMLTVEVTLRSVESQLSGDVRQIQGIERVGTRLEADTSDVKVLWLGNSMTAEGIDLSVADSILGRSTSYGISNYAVHPDGSGIPEWLYIATSDFFNRGAAPDLIVIPFAWNLLSDETPVEVARIGRWYLHSASDWLEFFGRDARGFEPRIHAVLANASTAFGNRDRIRNKILGLLPGYQEMAQELSRGGATAGNGGSSQGAGYSRLYRLLAAARKTDTQVVLVAMPVREPYSIDPSLQRLVDDASGVSLMDLREAEGIGPDSFRDGVHLLPDGARVVTASISERLTETLARGRAD